jgi:hypothetical protein
MITVCVWEQIECMMEAMVYDDNSMECARVYFLSEDQIIKLTIDVRSIGL